MDANRIVIAGESHVDAIKQALLDGDPARQQSIHAYRLRKLKGDRIIGDIDFDRLLDEVAALGDDGMVVSAIGGNQYNAFGLVQHPQAFDFYSPHLPHLAPASDREVLPYQLVRDLFSAGLQGSDGERVSRLVKATRASVFQLCPPPPKEDEGLIMRRHESLFHQKGLLEHGVTPAPIRLKLWMAQVKVLESLCVEWGCRLLPVPAAAVNAGGYLQPDYSARDATHGNAAYGDLVLAQVQSLRQDELRERTNAP